MMALTPDQQRRMRMRRMNLLMTYAMFAGSKTTVQNGALTLLGNELNGFSLDFTDNTVAMRVE